MSAGKNAKNAQSEPQVVVNVAKRVLGFLGSFRGIAALVAVFILGVIYSPHNARTGMSIFLTAETQKDILYEYAEYGILATGMTLVILSGGIDLSVGSVLGFAATLFSLLVMGYGWPPLLAVLVTVLAGASIGLINGMIISRFKMQPFVVTLATMVAARGAAKWISHGIKVQPGAEPWYHVKAVTPQFMTWLTSGVGGTGLQPITLVFLVNILLMIVVVRYSKFGRHLYAIGGNEEAARLSGIRVSWDKIAAYTLCAGMAAMAGISNCARLELGDPEAGSTYELDAIAAVVIGGTSLNGGRGGMFFTLIGTLIIGYINKILSLNSVEEAQRLLVKGAIIILAVLIQQRRRDQS